MAVRIGTRGSLLALAQTTFVADALADALAAPVQRHVVTTSGDRKQGMPQHVEDKREWVDTLEQALLRGTVDVALHSGKDVPAEVVGGTVLVPVLERAQPWDLFVGRRVGSETAARLGLAEVAAGSTLGTASARRATQLRELGLAARAWRGNVPTRVRRLDEQPSMNQADQADQAGTVPAEEGAASLAEPLAGIVLAAAGLERMRRTSLEALRLDEVDNFEPAQAEALRQQLAEVQALDLTQAHPFSPEQLLPAMNQGILVAQVRADHAELWEALKRLARPAVAAAFWAERTVVALLGADCSSAAAVYAEPLDGQRLRLRARVLDPHGSGRLEADQTGSLGEPYPLAAAVADELNAAGAQQWLERGRRHGKWRT